MSFSARMRVLLHVAGVLNGVGRVSSLMLHIIKIPFQGASPAPPSEAELPRNGVLTSLHFPEDYPTNVDQVQKIQVPEGNTIWIRFTDFRCEHEYDYVKIYDKDGTRLGFFDGGARSDDDWRDEISSNSNTVEVRFHTDGSVVYKGWKLVWGGYEVSISFSCFHFFPHRNCWR